MENPALRVPCIYKGHHSSQCMITWTVSFSFISISCEIHKVMVIVPTPEETDVHVMKVTGILEMFSSPHCLKAEPGFEPRFSSLFLVCSLHESGGPRLRYRKKWKISGAHSNLAWFLAHVPRHLGLWSTFCLQVDPDDRAASTWNTGSYGQSEQQE